MDDRKIQVFLAVVEQGSFSRASEQLHCTQSAVTQTINRLEGELGCKLLSRYHSGIRLTDAGKALYPDLQKAYESLVQLQKHADKLSEEKKIRLRIGAFSSVANTWLPKMLRSYSEAHPGLTLDLKICTGDLEDLLLQHQVDIAFGDHMRLSRVDFIPLMKDRYSVAVPEQFFLSGDSSSSEAANPSDIQKFNGEDMEHTVHSKCSITQKDLSDFPFLMAPMNALDQILTSAPERSVTVDCDDDITLLNMVAGGLGATIMPNLSLSVIPSGVKILPLEPELSRTIGIGLNPDAPEEARELCTFVQKTLGIGIS